MRAIVLAAVVGLGLIACDQPRTGQTGASPAAATADPDATVAVANGAAAPATPANCAKASPPNAAEKDILGLRPGMTLAEIETAIRCMKADYPLEDRRMQTLGEWYFSYFVKNAKPPVPTPVEGRFAAQVRLSQIVLVNGIGVTCSAYDKNGNPLPMNSCPHDAISMSGVKDAISLDFIGLPGEEVVASVKRVSHLDDVSVATVEAGLNKKYGAPSFSTTGAGEYSHRDPNEKVMQWFSFDVTPKQTAQAGSNTAPDKPEWSAETLRSYCVGDQVHEYKGDSLVRFYIETHYPSHICCAPEPPRDLCQTTLSATITPDPSNLPIATYLGLELTDHALGPKASAKMRERIEREEAAEKAERARDAAAAPAPKL